MVKTAELKIVQDRRQQLAKRQEELAAELASIEAEERENEIAERVFLRLSTKKHGPAENFEDDLEEIKLVVKGRKKGSSRPDGIPTTAEMVTTILAESKRTHPKGMTGPELIRQIDQRWWPGVGGNSILPTLWRMASKKTRITKFRDHYRLVKNEEGPQADED